MDINWKESNAHINLLSKFVKARDINQVLTWQYLNDDLNERPIIALERFCREEMLVIANIDESLNRLLTVTQLKKLLKERSLKITGIKSELIDRLLDSDRAGMEKLISGHRIMKCSPDALAIVSAFESEKQQTKDYAKTNCYEALIKNQPKEAYKAYISYLRFINDPAYRSDPYKVEELKFILSSAPKVLGKISKDDLVYLRAVAGMRYLWGKENPIVWLPKEVISKVDNPLVAINYINTNAKIESHLSRCKKYSKQVKVIFHPGDIDSCDLCQTLDGKVLNIEDMPELPMVGCTSVTGCQCWLEELFDDEFEDNLLITVNTKIDDLDPLDNLRQLKQMLDEGLITKDEYEKKKEEILAKM